MELNCETQSFLKSFVEQDMDVKYEPVVYDRCESCGALHPEGDNIVYNQLMGMRMCEACWDTLVWH